MLNMFLQVTLILINFLFLSIFNLRSHRFCLNIFKPTQNQKIGALVSLFAGYFLLSLTLFCALPVFIKLLIIYFLVMLLFLYLFKGGIIDFIFGSGTFMFHIMNVKMVVTSIFILIYDIPSYALFRKSGFYLSSTCVTILLLIISLEVFQRTFDRDMIKTLMKSNSQLRFVTCSMMLINIYLLILSISYNNQAYSSLAGIFLLITSLLLFGAFYTSFWHALKMSILLENEIKSRRLEEQLRATKEDVEELQLFAFTDTLTSVHNRRFGLDKLSKLLREHIPFCLCFLDIDHLKYVNDTFGHDEGDQYILNVVRALTGSCKKDDTLSRMGGDEFMLLMPHVSQKEADERLCEISETVLKIPSIYNPSVSYGIVEVKTDTELNASQILRAADLMMYQNKQTKIPGAHK